MLTNIVPPEHRKDHTPDVATSAQIGDTVPQQEGWKGVVSTVLILLAAPLIALVLIAFVFQSYEVDGPSMETTLQNQDRLIVNKIPRTIARITGKPYIPERGEIIIFVKHGSLDFDGSGEKQLIKRVIGLPGERVVLQNSKYTVYNAEYPQGFDPDTSFDRREGINASIPGSADFTVGENEVFVSGDNRPNSLDSRAFGPISADDIVGTLAFRIFPVGKAEKF
jgi:signal peptidase I